MAVRLPTTHLQWSTSKTDLANYFGQVHTGQYNITNKDYQPRGKNYNDLINVKNDRPGDDGTLRSVLLLVFLLGVIDIASISA